MTINNSERKNTSRHCHLLALGIYAPSINTELGYAGFNLRRGPGATTLAQGKIRDRKKVGQLATNGLKLERIGKGTALSGLPRCAPHCKIHVEAGHESCEGDRLILLHL
jgi:hypothetical protein